MEKIEDVILDYMEEYLADNSDDPNMLECWNEIKHAVLDSVSGLTVSNKEESE